MMVTVKGSAQNVGKHEVEKHEGLTNVFVGKLVTESYTLRLVLNGFAIHDGLTELLDDGLVNSIALRSSASHSYDET
jgi:hypothetical protein